MTLLTDYEGVNTRFGLMTVCENNLITINKMTAENARLHNEIAPARDCIMRRDPSRRVRHRRLSFVAARVPPDGGSFTVIDAASSIRYRRCISICAIALSGIRRISYRQRKGIDATTFAML